VKIIPSMTTALEQLVVPQLRKLNNSTCHPGQKARINGGGLFRTCPILTSWPIRQYNDLESNNLNPDWIIF
jgi:hypothetical protein